MAYKDSRMNGPISLNSSGASATTIGGGTNTGTISLGNASSGIVSIECGTAGLAIGPSSSGIITIGSLTGVSDLTVDMGTSGFSLSSDSTIMTATSSGHINEPLQPSFCATQPNSVNTVTGNATVYTVIYPTVVYDQTSSYDNSTGTYTIPHAGKYLIHAAIFFNGILSTHTSGFLNILVNSSIRAQSIANPYKNALTLGLTKMEVTASLNLAASDAVIVQLIVTGGTKVINITGNTYGNNFYAHLLE